MKPTSPATPRRPHFAAGRKSTSDGPQCDEDDDLMRALAEIPPLRLTSIDDAFSVLDSGLGAIFSASMARRAAVLLRKEKDTKDGSKPSSPMSPKSPKSPRSPREVSTPTSRESTPQSVRGSGCLKKGKRGALEVGDTGSAQKSGTDSRGVKLLRAATKRFRAPMRRVAAQKVTMKMMAELAKEGEEDDMGSDASASMALSAYADDVLKGGRQQSPDGRLPEDASLRTWAEQTLHLPREKLHGLESSGDFRTKLGHQMLSWRALRASKLPLPEPTDDEIRLLALIPLSPLDGPALFEKDAGTRDGSPPRRPPRLATAAASLFDLPRHLDAQRSRRSLPSKLAAKHGLLWKAGTQVVAAPEEVFEVREVREGRKTRRMSSVAAADDMGGAGLSTLLAGAWKRDKEDSPSLPGTAGGGRKAPVSTSTAAKPLPPPTSTLPGFLDDDVEEEVDTLGHLMKSWAARLASSGQAREGPFGVTLRQPLTFMEPHTDVRSTDIADTPEFAYVRRCELGGIVPCPAVWRRFGDGIVDVHKRQLGDDDVIAIVETAVDCASRGHVLRTLELSGNCLTDAGLCSVARLLAGPPSVCGALSTLSLAGNATLRIKSREVLDELSRGLQALPALVSLDLSGVPMPCQAVVTLASALAMCEGLRSLSLAGCGLGRADQSECVAIAALLGQRPDGSGGLEIADFSANFFGHAGFAAAGAALRKSHLKSLSFAGNGGGGGRGRTPQFHPVQLLLEGLFFNTSLERLDLASCSIGPDSAFVLEDALQTHHHIRDLLLSDNPLGEDGIRCVVRLLLALNSDIRTCEVVGHRQADESVKTVQLRFTQPGGEYRLDLGYPHERATLRMLLSFGVSAAGLPRQYRGSISAATTVKSEVLKFFKFDAKLPKPTIDLDPDTGRWLVPTQGTFTFNFCPPTSGGTRKSVSTHKGQKGALNKVTAEKKLLGGVAIPRSSMASTTTKVRSSFLATGGLNAQALLGAQVHDAQTGRRLGFFQRKGTLNAGGDSRVGTASSSGSETKEDEPVREDAAWLLRDVRMPVSALRYPVVRGMFLSLLTQEQQVRFVRAVSRDLHFNCAQVTQLCEDRPEMASQIMCSLFPCIVGRSSQLLLLGSKQMLGNPQVMAEVKPCLWFQQGNLTGRFDLYLQTPTDYIMAENCLVLNAWEVELGKAKSRPDVSQRGTYEMLRNEAHNEAPFTYYRGWSLPSSGLLRFDYSSIRRPPPGLKPTSEASEITRFLKGSKLSSAAIFRALRAISIHIYLSAGQLRRILLCFSEPQDRQDLFCMFHTRAVDPQRLLGPDVFRDADLFRPEDQSALLKRLGYLHLLNPFRPDSVPLECNLAVYEERKVVEYLVQLTCQEPGGRVRGHAMHDPNKPVPASWAKKGVPTEEKSYLCIYNTLRVKPSWREELAKKYCIGTFVWHYPQS